jgi:hypothetical protein
VNLRASMDHVATAGGDVDRICEVANAKRDLRRDVVTATIIRLASLGHVSFGSAQIGPLKSGALA